MSEHERTGWRDEDISRRHRQWGFNCPAADLDWLVVEYSVGEPAALVEYKHNAAPMPNILHPNYQAQKKLANNSRIPCMIVFYSKVDWSMRVFPLNRFAEQHYEWGQVLSERQYVTSLYKLRCLAIQRKVLDRLNATTAGQEPLATVEAR